MELAKYTPDQLKVREAWGGFGMVVQKAEISLQVQAQALIKRLSVAVTKETIAAAEKELKEVKAELDKLKEDRLGITRKFDPPIARLSAPEKSLLEPLQKFTQKIIDAKREKEADDKLTQQKAYELKQVREKTILYVADMHAGLLLAQNDLIAKAYSHALDNVPPDALEPFLVKVRARATTENYTTPKPVFFAIHSLQSDVDTAVADAFAPEPPQSYVDSFYADLADRFKDYKLAWQNKEQARAIASSESTANTKAIEQEKQSTAVVARLEALAAPLAPVQETKALKKTWTLDLEETQSNALLIASAFMANLDVCLPKLTVKKWFNLSVSSMAGALEKLRNDDDQFDFTGLNWKAEEKL